MQIEGSCHRARITFRAEIDPDAVYLCHCTDCQAISGSPFRWAVPVGEEKFDLLTGASKAYAKTGDSGRTNDQMFCPDCASPIYSYSLGVKPVVFRLRLGTLRQRAALLPKAEFWCDSQRDWACDLPGSQRVARQ